MQKRVWIIIAIIALVLIGFFIYQASITGNAVKQPSSSITRTVKYSKGLWQVTLKSNINSYAVGVSEQIPDNTTVTKVSAQGVIKENTIEWLFAPGKRVTMTYTLKPNANITSINLFGNWKSIEEEGNILGNKTWTIPHK
jgi:hypothetical protein